MSQDGWKNSAWEALLSKIWDNKPKGTSFVFYTKSDIAPILERYTKSGQGEIRIFHSGHVQCEAVRKRGVMELPISRSEWVLVEQPPRVVFSVPTDVVKFQLKRPMTAGMTAALKTGAERNVTPGETTLLSIARHIGILEDFYSLDSEGVMFTGGRQAAVGCQIIINDKTLDLSKAQIEIDGGFEWSETIILAEVKSSLDQDDFEINQALLPLIKWKNLVPSKKVYSMVLLCNLKTNQLIYQAYDLAQDTIKSPIGMFVVKSKKYIIEVA